MNPLSYSDDYVQYDEFGIKSIHCMLCGEVVKRRTEKLVDHPNVPGQKVIQLRLVKLPNWRQRKVTTTRNGRPGGYMEPIVCENCVGVEMDFDRLAKQVKGALRKELVQHGRELPDIDIRVTGELRGRAK
jgi:hypothetical protein